MEHFTRIQQPPFYCILCHKQIKTKNPTKYHNKCFSSDKKNIEIMLMEIERLELENKYMREMFFKTPKQHEIKPTDIPE
jgi:hypothetical protein